MKFLGMSKLNRRSSYCFSLLLLLVVCASMNSCVTANRIYFKDLRNDTLTPETPPYVMEHTTKFIDPRIEPNDVLAVTIQTIEQNPSNTPITTNSNGSFNELNGFLVDKDGYIELSLIGKVKVGGLTTSEAREIIKQKANEYWKDPVVNLRISNFDIQVLGDVSKPGILTSPSEKISIIDAIAMSGDLNLSARHKNILLVRTEGERKTFVRLDVTNSNIFQSPYFYLKQRDMLYVEPGKSKLTESNSVFNMYFGYFSAFVSILTALIAFNVIKIH